MTDITKDTIKIDRIKKNKNINSKKHKVKSLKTKKLLINNNNNKSGTKLLEYISFAKIIAVFSVVILHTNSAFWKFKYNSYKTYWLSANRIHCIFYFAVPIFVLCIGATLLDFNEKYGLLKYFYKRITKVVMPMICWNIILYLYRVYILKTFKKEKLTFVKIWNIYYGHEVYFIFESFHIFLIGYMIIPLLAYVQKSEKVKIYSYCFITLLITQTICPYLINLFEPRLKWIYSIKVGYIIYIFAGYIIQNYKFKKIWKIIIYFLGICSLLVHMIGTKILTLKYRKINLLHKGYLNLPCIIYSCAVFLFIKEYTYLLFKIIDSKKINKIGSLTIGPFFMHLPIKDACKKYFKSINYFGLQYRLFGGFLICLFCLIITFYLKKIPIIKYLVP